MDLALRDRAGLQSGLEGARACRVERGAATADTVWRLKRATLGRRKYGQKALLRATVLNVEALVP